MRKSCVVSQDGAFSVATCLRLDGPEFEPWQLQDFAYLSRLTLRPTQHPVQCVPFLFMGGGVARV